MDAGPYHGISLARLFPDGRIVGADNIRVTACSAQAAACRPGDLFVAVLGADGDSHDSAELAVERGATAVLTQRLLPLDVPQCIVANTNSALAQLCQQLAGNPAATLPVIGIAGQSGKSVTERLLGSVLRAAGREPATFGGGESFDGVETKAQPAEGHSLSTHYARWLAQSLANGCTHAIATLTRQHTLNRRYEGAPLQVLVLTGFSSASHRRRPSPQITNYFHRALGLLSPEGAIVACDDCPVTKQLLKGMEQRVLWVSTNSLGDVAANLLERFASEQTFLMDIGADTVPVRTRVIGAEHVQRCLLAAAAGLTLRLDLPHIVAGVEAVDSVPGRLERLECGQAFSVFVDSAVSVAELHMALETVSEVTAGRTICVFGEGVLSQRHLRSRRGETVERLADVGVITSDTAADRQPLQTIHDVLDGYEDPAKAHVMPNRVRAVEWALATAEPGDSVLVVGPHNRMPASRVNHLPDADVARSWLLDSSNQSLDWLAGMPK